MQSTGQGCFVFSWEQVELDGLTGSPPETMAVGATWRWAGRAMRVDDPRDILILRDWAGQGDLRARSAARARRMLGAPARGASGGAESPDADCPANGFDLTDGLDLYRAVILPRGTDLAPLVMFTEGLPPPETDLWVLRQEVKPRGAGAGQGLICFVPGTLIETESGPRPVERILPGDRLLTADNGAQTVTWRAERRVTASRLIAMPWLRPIRIEAGLWGAGRPEPELIVSPDHRLVLGGAPARDLFGTDEVLATARDLVGLPGIRTLRRPAPVTYIHLMLERHEVLRANGVACESFHPVAADLGRLGRDEAAQLGAALPGVLDQPATFGDFARRLVSRAEAALMLHGMARGH